MTSKPVFELYHNHMSTCSAKVRIVLAEKNQQWTGHLMDLRAGDNLKSEYLKLNPAGVVPTLIADSRPLVESTVICEYIDDAVADTPLRPRDAWEAAQMRLWTKQLDDGVHFATGVVSFCIAFREQFLAKRPEEIQAFLAGLQSEERRERLKVSLGKGIDAPFFPPAVKRMTKLLDDMEQALKRANWLAGPTYSLADIAMTPYVVRLEHLGFGFQLEERPRLADWMQRIRARRSFDDAMVHWYEPSYLDLFEQVRSKFGAKLRALTH